MNDTPRGKIDKNNKINTETKIKLFWGIGTILSCIIFISFVCFYIWFLVNSFTYLDQWVELDTKIENSHILNQTCSRYTNDCDIFGNNCIEQKYSCYQIKVDISIPNFIYNNSLLIFNFDDDFNKTLEYNQYYIDKKNQKIKVFCRSPELNSEGCYLHNLCGIKNYDNDHSRKDEYWDKYQKRPSDYDFWVKVSGILSFLFLLILIFFIVFFIFFFTCMGAYYCSEQ